LRDPHEGFSPRDRDHPTLHLNGGFLKRPDRRGLPHTAVTKVVVIIKEAFVNHEEDDD
jgi:hypothetical protein